MNYIETGLPHTDLIRRKSDFVPPRYKPLCNLGRRYLGLDPLSKSELESVTNRLCQPKKLRQADDPSTFQKGYRPMTYGSGRFSGRRRLTGDQIETMVARLTKKKPEHDSADQDKTKSDSESKDEIMEENHENTDAVTENTKEKDTHKRNDVDSVKVLDRIPAVVDAQSSSATEHGDIFNHHTVSLTCSQEKHKTKDKAKEGERYESLYYRGVKTENSRKFIDKNFKRLSVHSLHSNEKSGVIKTPKTEIYSMNKLSESGEISFRPMRMKST